MNNSNVYVGVIKKCKSLYSYNKYGERRFEGDYRTRSMVCGTYHEYTSLIDDQAVLIKVAEGEYIPLKYICTFGEKLLVDLGVKIHTIKSQPEFDGSLFVDERYLVPYFDEEDQDKSMSVHKLKMTTLMDPRIKGGIEN